MDVGDWVILAVLYAVYSEQRNMAGRSSMVLLAFGALSCLMAFLTAVEII